MPSNRTLLMSLLVLVICLCFLWSREIVRGTAEPVEHSAYFQPARIDLGTVEAGAKITFEAKLYNASNQKLKVVSIRKSCTCTQSEIDEEVLLPGSESVVRSIVQVPRGPDSFAISVDAECELADKSQFITTFTAVGRIVGVSGTLEENTRLEPIVTSHGIVRPPNAGAGPSYLPGQPDNVPQLPQYSSDPSARASNAVSGEYSLPKP